VLWSLDMAPELAAAVSRCRARKNRRVASPHSGSCMDPGHFRLIDGVTTHPVLAAAMTVGGGGPAECRLASRFRTSWFGNSKDL
jgi:hypothetical protein